MRLKRPATLLICFVISILVSCNFDFEVDEHALDDFDDNFNPKLPFTYDSTTSFFLNQLSIIDTNPDSIYALVSLKYDSVVIVEQYGFNYRFEGDDDSLALNVHFLKERDTIDFRLLNDNTFIYSSVLDLDTSAHYIICNFFSMKCEHNPTLEDRCYNDWYTPGSCTVINFQQ